MSDKSKYLDHLPSVLWEQEPPGEFSLGSLLRIFEKVLTGIDDGVEIRHEIRHELHMHDPVSALIGRLDQLFDPWRTPEQFLPWLASWVALEFPTSQGQPLWDEYQRRKVTSEIARIYRKRGLKEGLNQHLRLLALGNTRPRIAIDDGSRLLVTSPIPGRLAPIATLMSQGPVIDKTKVVSEGMIRPWCMAAAPDGSLFIGDRGVELETTPPAPFKTIRNRVWRISATGQYGMVGAPPTPRPLAPDSLFEQPRAVAVRQQRSGQPEALYILDRNGKLYGLPSPYTDAQAQEIVSLAAGTPAFWPVAMAVDTTGDLLVLDRGSAPGTQSSPKIITVPLDTVPVDPSKITRRALNLVIEPLSLLVLPNGRLIIGDGREQAPTKPDQFSGNLVSVDRSNPSTWNEKLLLPTSNLLVAPTGITRDSSTHIYVLDVGLKPFLPTGDPFVVKVAEPAGIFRVDLGADLPLITRATETGRLVFPTGMVAIGGQLFACDPGHYHTFTGLLSVWCRLLPFRFSVTVHFAESRLPGSSAERKRVREQVYGNVRDIVEQHKPAHSHLDLVRYSS